ncbi:MAG: DUF424 family protein [archaeon]
MYYKVHKSYREVIAICDSELLGKKFEEEDKLLEVRETFYNGEEVSEAKIHKIMEDFAKEDATFNIVGEKSVNIALKLGIVSKEGIKKVQGVPFALVLL